MQLVLILMIELYVGCVFLKENAYAFYHCLHTHRRVESKLEARHKRCDAYFE